MENSNRKKVALTFDDGPNPPYTVEILKLLEKYQAKATFFVIGSIMGPHAKLVKEIADAGHEIGNHTWTHGDLTKMSREEIVQEIYRTSDLINKIISVNPKLYRPPYGEINDEIREIIDLTPVLWSVSSEDWRTEDPNEIYQNTVDNVEDGSIVLLHEIHQGTIDALEDILKFLVKEDYQFVTVSELNN